MSYGEARRVLLARALVNEPELLILDEPCSGLDIPSKEIFLQTVQWAAKRGTQMIYVTHHIEEIISDITHVLFSFGLYSALHILSNVSGKQGK